LFSFFDKIKNLICIKVVYISDINQLLVQYYLLIVEKRNSIHEAFVPQQQQQTITSNDEGAKWILEPLVLFPLDPTMFLRKELFEVCFY